MASYQFERAGEEGTITAAGESILITVGADGAVDPTGEVSGAPPWEGIEICAPVQPGGEFKLLRVAKASVGEQWVTRRDQQTSWPIVTLTLDQPGFEISYVAKRLLIDNWQLVPSDQGQGWVEVLSLRAMNLERRRGGQEVISRS
jgi:hypothetical protein